MVNRRFLTADYVDNLDPPNRGEVWIADTGLKGFGLRLWATKSGGHKAYAIRIASSAGNLRKAYRIWDSRAVSFAIRSKLPVPTLGNVIDDARSWARREIYAAKKPELLNQQREKFSRDSERIQRIVFGEAANRLLRNMRHRGLSERYVDQLEKLFFGHISAKLQNVPLGDVRAKSIIKVLAAKNITPHNAMVLRSFISQIFLKASHSHEPFIEFPQKLSEELWPHWEKTRDVKYPELKNLGSTSYRKLFKLLERDHRWQQALAIRLYFKFHVPLKAILAGRWAEIINERWYPYDKHQRKYWTAYVERLDAEALKLLAQINRLIKRDFGSSIHFFPSAGRENCHITTVQKVWSDALKEMRLPFYPLQEFSRSYRELNSPTYYRWFIGYYGPVFDEMENAAKLSKSLTRRINYQTNSNDYR